MTIHALPDRSTVRGQVAAEVRAELGRNRISVNRLPRLLGKSQSYWSRRVTAEQPMDVDDLAALASLMNVPVAKFFGGTSETPHPDDPDGGMVRREGIEPPTRWFRGARLIRDMAHDLRRAA